MDNNTNKIETQEDMKDAPTVYWNDLIDAGPGNDSPGRMEEIDSFLKEHGSEGSCTSIAMADGFMTAILTGPFRVPRRYGQGLEIVWRGVSSHRDLTDEEWDVHQYLFEYMTAIKYVLDDFDWTFYPPIFASAKLARFMPFLDEFTEDEVGGQTDVDIEDIPDNESDDDVEDDDLEDDDLEDDDSDSDSASGAMDERKFFDYYQNAMYGPDDGDGTNIPLIVQWCRGYMQFVELDRQAWSPIFASAAGRDLMAPIMFFADERGWNWEFERTTETRVFRRALKKHIAHYIYHIRYFFTRPPFAEDMNGFLKGIASYWSLDSVESQHNEWKEVRRD